MGKKHKARFNEIKRLQSLHGESALNGVRPEQPTAAVIGTPVAPPMPSNGQTTTLNDHVMIRKEIVFLVGVLILMLVLLLGFSWLVKTTGFSQWLLGVIGF